MRLRRARTSLLLGLLLGTPVVLSDTRVPAESPEPAVTGTAVVDALRAQERAAVLVIFHLPGHVDPLVDRLDTPEALGAIQAAGNELLARFAPGEFELRYQYRAINALAGEVNEDGLARLRADPHVLRVDLDEPTRAMLAQAVPLSQLDLVHDLGFTGSGITVAVIDSGIDADHPDLVDDLVFERCFCSSGGGCCPNGMIAQAGPGSAEDGQGHGTNVSGIVTSAGIVAPEGGAPDASIVAVKTLSDLGIGMVSDDLMALDWIIAQQPDVDLINMGLGTNTLFPGACDQANSTTMA